MAQEVENRIRFYKLEPGPNLEFLADLGVSGLPTFLFYKDGEVKVSLSGTHTRMDELVAAIGELI